MRSIIVGIDGSNEGTEAARVAASLARGLDRRLVLAHIVDDLPATSPWNRWRRELQQRQLVRGATGLIEAVANEIGEPEARRRITHGSVEDGLAMLSREEQADLLVVGSRERHPLVRAFLGGPAGSPTASLASSSACPLLVVPHGALPRFAEERRAPFGTILCGIDGSIGSDRAGVVAAGLAEGLGLQLIPIAVGRAGRSVESEDVVHVGGRAPAAALAEVASRTDSPLIVVGMRGREVRSRSVSRELAATAPAPVLIVPPRARLPRFSPARTADLAVAA